MFFLDRLRGKYLFIPLLILHASVHAAEIDNQRIDYYGPREKSAHTPTTYSFSKEHEYRVFSFNGKVEKNSVSTGEDYFTAGIKTSYGQLFSSRDNGFLSFGYLTGHIDSTNNIRFNTSISHLLPAFDSELFATYRLFGTHVSSTFETLGYGEDHVFENSLAAGYTTYPDIFLKKASFSYSYSLIPGQVLRHSTYNSQTPDHNYPTYLVGGFGDIESQAIAADVTLGTEGLPLDFFQGFKIDFTIDYKHVHHGGYYNTVGKVTRGMSGQATLQHRTDIGLLKGTYRVGPSSSTVYAGIHLGGVELYMKDTSYDDGDSTQVYGLRFKLNLYKLESALTPDPSPLFTAQRARYTSVTQIHHFDELTSDSFCNSPKLQEAVMYARK